MGVTKSDQFSPQQNRIAAFAKTLGHPARVAILEHLFARDTCVCGELVLKLGLAQATISQHLRELKDAGLIKGEIEGRRVCYCIDSKTWSSMRLLLSTFFTRDASSCC